MKTAPERHECDGLVGLECWREKDIDGNPYWAIRTPRDDHDDPYLNHVRYCPFCGQKLEDE